MDDSSANGEVVARDRRRGLLFLSIASAAVSFAIFLQLGLNNNFLVEEIRATGIQAGMLEAVRESCGIAAFAVLALIAGLAEPIIAFIVLLVFAGGLAAYGVAPSYAWVVGLSLVWSMGLHVWMPLPNSMALALAEEGRAGARLGQVAAAGSIGSGIGLAAAFSLHWAGVPIRPLYFLAGGAAVMGAVACLFIPRRLKTPGPRFVFKRAYGVYYLMAFFEGWRKQVALCFAGFLLVKSQHASLSEMLLLWGAIQCVGYFTARPVGRLIDRIGERPVLAFYYTVLIGLFCGYAFVTTKYLLYAIFLFDGFLGVCTTAFSTYVGRLAPKSEHTAVFSMGVAMNHIAAVSMPLVGGILWKTLGYQWAFLVGIPAALASLALVSRLPKRATAAAE